MVCIRNVVSIDDYACHLRDGKNLKNRCTITTNRIETAVNGRGEENRPSINVRRKCLMSFVEFLNTVETVRILENETAFGYQNANIDFTEGERET